MERIVVKVGTSTITHQGGKLNYGRIEKIVRELADLRNAGYSVVLVTSGSIGAGMARLGMKTRPTSIPEKQAAASVGQGLLMQMYEKMFSEYGQTTGQILLTREDFRDRKRYLNSRNTILTLLEFGVVPVVNENDTVAVDEIRFGDNDTLSALVASLIQADLLIVLSDVAGLYTADPRKDPQAQLIPEVKEITKEIEMLAGGAGSNAGTGGMATKIQAAKIAVSSGTMMVVADGSRDGVINDIVAGKNVGTRFLPAGNTLHGKKRWIAFYGKSRGAIVVDGGAVRAIVQGGKSLLPSGIRDVLGDFDQGDLVRVLDDSGNELARGLVNYSKNDLMRIKGLQSSEIEGVLGHRCYDEVIHRDNLALSKNG